MMIRQIKFIDENGKTQKVNVPVLCTSTLKDDLHWSSNPDVLPNIYDHITGFSRSMVNNDQITGYVHDPAIDYKVQLHGADKQQSKNRNN